MLIKDVGLVPVGETHRALSPNILDLAWRRYGGGHFRPKVHGYVSEVQACAPAPCPPAASLRYQKDEKQPRGL